MSFTFDSWMKKHALDIAGEDAECHFGWVDIETTGLDRDQDVILEFGFVMTDENGEVIEESEYHALVWEDTDHYRERLAAMIPLVREMHNRSGLLADLVHNETKTVRTVQADVLQLMSEFSLSPRDVMWAGSSVHFDVGLLDKYMFDLNQFMHYRQNNVSTLKVLCDKLNPELYAKIASDLSPFSAHRSMSDLGDSINEYRSYVDNFLWV